MHQSLELNELALQLVEELLESREDYRVIEHDDPETGVTVDCGVNTIGSLDAGQVLSAITLSGLADVQLTSAPIGDLVWPHVAVCTDEPVSATLFSQYAGWKVCVGKYFGMGSGPMRSAAASESLFEKLNYREETEHVVGVLESAKLPGPDVFAEIAGKCQVEPMNVTLLVAPTASLAGNYQVVSRSVETAMHKLFELGFDVHRVKSAWGIAPLAPVAGNDLQGIGRTNDAILYGARVTLWVDGDDDSLAEIIRKVPSNSSAAHGQPFLNIFEAAGRDFYKVDPLLFSPAVITLQNLDTGRVHHAGQIAPDVLRTSFGL